MKSSKLSNSFHYCEGLDNKPKMKKIDFSAKTKKAK